MNDSINETVKLLPTLKQRINYGCNVNSSPANLLWKNIVVQVKKTGKILLNNVNGLAKANELTGIIGGSGSGKTTLLNAVMLRNLFGLEFSGTVTVNNCSMGRSIEKISAYIPQDDLFVPCLTVREHLYFHANLRLSNETTADRIRHIDQLLAQLNLLECQNVRIGANGSAGQSLAGGEKKRLFFATELLNNPQILLCDEPTSSLDSSMAEQIIKVLAAVAHSGKTVLCTVHQPASELFYMFDRLIFMAEGRTIFVGSPVETVEFFEHCGYCCPVDYNPADFIVQTLAIIPQFEDQCHLRILQIQDAYRNSHSYKHLFVECIQPAKTVATVNYISRQPTFIAQALQLTKRSVLENFRTPSLALTKFSQKFAIGLFVGLLYFQTISNSSEKVGIQNINAALFFIVCELSYAAMYGVLTTFPSNFPLLIHEYYSGIYGVTAFYLGKTIAYLPLFSLDGVLFLIIAYWMIGLAGNFSCFIQTLIVGIAIEQTSTAFGLMLSASLPSFSVAIAVAAPLSALFALTGGFYANVGFLPAYISWIQYFSWFRYGFEALAINQWINYNTTNANSVATTVLTKLSFSDDSFNTNLIALICLFLLFHIVGFIGLTYRVHKAR